MNYRNFTYRRTGDPFYGDIAPMFWIHHANRTRFAETRAVLAEIDTVTLLLIPWRFPWVCVSQVFRLGFVFSLFLAFGQDTAQRAWRDTQ